MVVTTNLKFGIKLWKWLYFHIRKQNFYLPEEKFALSDQIRRCAVSVPSNIVEGYGRQSDKEFLKFLYIARGSIFELETQLKLCSIIHNIDNTIISTAFGLVDETNRMLSSLISYFKNKDNDQHQKTI